VDLGEVASFTFVRMLIAVPSLVRVWWGDLSDRQLTRIVDQYTTKFISPSTPLTPRLAFLGWHCLMRLCTLELISLEMDHIAQFKKEASGKAAPAAVEYTSYLTPDGSEFSMRAYRGGSHEVHATYKKDEIEATIILKYSITWS